MPVSGTARYAGPVGGLYSYRYGNGWSAVDEPPVTEEFTGTMTIHADFADNSLTGCIGCIGDIEITRDNLYTVPGIQTRGTAGSSQRLRGAFRQDAHFSERHVRKY